MEARSRWLGLLQNHGPLARTAEEAGAAGVDVPGPDCVDVPVVGEVCVTAKTEAALGSEGA